MTQRRWLFWGRRENSRGGRSALAADGRFDEHSELVGAALSAEDEMVFPKGKGGDHVISLGADGMAIE